MAKQRYMELTPPIGGVNRRLAYQRQAPYTCYDACNVIGSDVHESRGRIGNRPGSRAEFTVLAGKDIFLLDTITYVVDDVRKTRMLAVCDGFLYSSDPDTDVFTIVDSEVYFGHGVTLQGTAYKQDYYIADHGPKYQANDGALTVAGTNTLTSTEAGDFAAHGVTTSDSVEIFTTGDSEGAVIGTYAIATVATTTLTISGSPGVTETGVGFRVVSGDLDTDRMIKVYDAATNTVDDISISAGDAAPVNCRAITTYHDRIVTAVDDQWYMSAAGDGTDWDYADDDTNKTRAASGANTQAGIIAQPVMAITNHGDNCCLFWGLTEMYIMRGDPTYGGRLDPAGEVVGCVGNVAVAKGSGGHFFMSKDGLQAVAFGCGSLPREVSRPVLPDDMIEIDANPESGDRVILEYNHDMHGLFIFLTANTPSATTTHWYYDFDNNAFWPIKFGHAGMQVLSACKRVDEGAQRTDILMGCSDGKIRSFVYAQDDDLAAMSSYCDIGPFQLGSVAYMGRLMQVTGVLSSDTNGTVTCEVTTAESGEAAAKHTGVYHEKSVTWSAGKNAPNYRMGENVAAMFKLTGQSTKNWALEQIVALIRQGGKAR